jgi:hypothetical protein
MHSTETRSAWRLGRCCAGLACPRTRRRHDARGNRSGDGQLVCAIGLADGTDLDALDGDTVCVAVGVALGKLVHTLDGDTVCVEVGKLEVVRRDSEVY